MSASSKSGGPDASFFYGTLMFPSITSRLLGRTIPSDQISEANLDGFIRLHILERDYPAVVSVEEARQKFGDLGEKSVRGVVVSGLSEKELELLDAWEADEYVKTVLPVNIDGEKRDVWVYVWNMEQYGVLLKPEVWKLEAFVRDKLDQWSGGGGSEFDEYTYGDIDALRNAMEEAKEAPFPNGNSSTRQ